MKRSPLFALFIPFCLLLFPDCVSAQSLGFWNVENLFDTLDTPLHDDADFTPSGRYRWDSTRYWSKIHRLAGVLDAMALDVVGLCEVEGPGVLRDLISTTKTPYAYLWLPTGDVRGIDQALLYKGDRFFPDPPRMVRSGYSRGFLYVRGELAGGRIDLIVCHLPSMLNRRAMRERAHRALARFVAQLQRDPEARVVVMGDMNALPDDRMFRALPLRPVLADQARKGRGSYAYDGQWQLLDQIWVGDSLAGRVERSGIYIRDRLLRQDASPWQGYPLRTFSGRTWLGGYSDHLPVYMIFEK